MSNKTSLSKHIKDGMTILVSGIDSFGYPKMLVEEIIESGAKNLTLAYIETNAELDKEHDPADIVLNHQVSHLITSHMGALAKGFNEYLDSIELLPMGVFCQKVQAAGNNLPGIMVDYNLASCYRDEKYLSLHTYVNNGKKMVFEEAIKADIGIIDVDKMHLPTFHCMYDGTATNSQDIAKASKLCFAEYHKLVANYDFDGVDIPGFYITDAVKSNTEHYVKTNW